MPELMLLHKAGLSINRAILNLSRLILKTWWPPIHDLRRAEGLSPGRDPLLDDKFAPELGLALFSRWMAQPQPDWPPQTVQPGFVFFDRPHVPDEADKRLASFLDAGEPPIVFTQGSTAVHHPGEFYKVSVEAARRIGGRAILIGADPEDVPASSDLLAVRYAWCASVPRSACRENTTPPPAPPARCNGSWASPIFRNALPSCKKKCRRKMESLPPAMLLKNCCRDKPLTRVPRPIPST